MNSNAPTSGSTGEERNRARAERDAVWKSLSQRISHKLGNPIATISLIEGNMRHSLTEEEKTGLLDDLRDTLKKCNRLLQEMKNYAATGVKLARTESRELLPLLARPFEKKSYNGGIRRPPLCSASGHGQAGTGAGRIDRQRGIPRGGPGENAGDDPAILPDGGEESVQSWMRRKTTSYWPWRITVPVFRRTGRV